MGIGRRRILLALATAVAMLAVLPGLAQAKFQLGLQDPTLDGLGTDASSAPGYQAASQLGASFVRVNISWAQVAGTTPFDLSNPADPHYKWTHTDAAVRRAAQHHLQVLLMVFNAPTWAEGPNIPPPTDPNVQRGAWEPNAVLFGQFMHAVAERYNGNFPDALAPGTALPRVRYYQLWNEPNLGGYIAGPDQVGQLRNLENAGSAAIKSVNPSNMAVMAGLAPVATVGIYSTHPLTTARELLCLRQVRGHYARIKGCPSVHLDIFAAHPYTLAATPTKRPNNPNDLLVQDVYKLHDIIRAAERLHTISRGNHPLWVSEWSWFTNPPQTAYGNPPSDAGRYVAYSMYSFWKAGVSMVIWQALADVAGSPFTGGGLETSAGVPKPSMTAFAFPFFASVKGHKGYGWGRAPSRQRVRVFVQHQVKGQWRRVATVRTDGYGVFQVHFRARGNGTYRAQVQHGSFSLPYFSARIPGKRTSAYNFG